MTRIGGESKKEVKAEKIMELKVKKRTRVIGFRQLFVKVFLKVMFLCF
jgi:hypothetical protein